MNRATIKSAYLKIQASDAFKQKTVLLLKGDTKKRTPHRLRRVIPIAASFVVIVSVVTVFLFLKSEDVSSPQNTVTIPKMNPPTDNPNASMMALVAYNDKVYTSTGTDIDIDSANKILGNKLETQKDKKWSENSTSPKKLITNFPGDVYSVKGYDSSFRIMVIFTNFDEKKEAFLFECCNGVTITSGKDVFGKLKMQGNALSMTYVQHQNCTTPIYSIKDDKLMNSFIDALNHTTPYLFESGNIPSVDWNNPTDFRHIRIKLKDGCNVQLTLAKGEYILYGDSHVVFKMNSSKFHELWDKLDYTKDPSINSR